MEGFSFTVSFLLLGCILSVGAAYYKHKKTEAKKLAWRTFAHEHKLEFRSGEWLNRGVKICGNYQGYYLGSLPYTFNLPKPKQKGWANHY